MSDARAIVFDLDDTLYPYHAFVRSGLAAVAQRVSAEYGLSFMRVLRVLRRGLVECRGWEVQMMCAVFGLPVTAVPELVTIMRSHRPKLRLPGETRRVLKSLRSDWRIGVLTNGSPEIQRRKIAALGVGALVDHAWCAEECGAATGKPAPEVFRTALARMNVTADRTVFVGDDRQADIDGAAAVGMKTIHLTVHRPAAPPCDGACHGVHAGSLGQVPELADRLVPVRI